MKKNNNNLDVDEQKILDSFNRGEWVSKGENLDKYKEAAKQTFSMTRQIDFRVSEKDFKKIQIKAMQEGIPYQTLVSHIIHKYLSGHLKEI